MARDKIETYLGFCIRSGRIEFGVDRAESLKKGVYLLMASASLSENSMKTLVKLKEKFSWSAAGRGGRGIGRSAGIAPP